MTTSRRLILGTALAMPALRVASAQEAVTYLFPAPPFLPAFAPHQIAMKRGYYAANGLNGTFQTGQGGANVATQVGTGNATLGGGVGETSMLVRANGVPVRGVALLGGRSLFSIAVRKAVFPWSASGRALGMGRGEGFTKLLFAESDGRLIGAGMVGAHAGELVAEATLAIELGADAHDLGLTVHAHPTLSETVALAAEVAAGTVTDLMPPRDRTPKRRAGSAPLRKRSGSAGCGRARPHRRAR